jgi:hypothetical protein
VADCIHHLDICPDCAGLRVVQLDRLEGVTSVALDGRPLGSGGEVKVYIGPAPGPCPNPSDQAPTDSASK